MYASYTNPSLLSRLGAAVLYFLRSFSPVHGSKGTVYPKIEHLDHNRHVFMAPSVALDKFLKMLTGDEDFVRALPQNNSEYLIILGICQDELRANVFRVESDPSLSRLHNYRWFNDGLFHYHLLPDRVLTPVIRDMPGRFYHPDDVVLSYSRVLTTSELMEIDQMRRHSN